MKVTKGMTQSQHPHQLSLDSSPYAFTVARPQSKRVNLRPNADKPFTVALSTMEVSRRNKNSSLSPRESRTNSRSKMERNMSDTSSRGLLPTNLNKNKMLKSIKSNPRYAQLLFKKMQFPEALTQTQVKSSFILQNLNSPQEEFRLPQNSQHMRDYFATTPQGLNYWNQQIREKERKEIEGSTKRGNKSHFSSLEGESEISQNLLHDSQYTQPSPTNFNSSLTNISPRRFGSTNRVQTAYSQTNRTVNTNYRPPMTAAPEQSKRGMLQNVQLPSVIPQKTGKKSRIRTSSVPRQNESPRVKIPRDLPLSSSPLRNSYEIVRDTLMTNMFKHTAFNPAMLTNHQKKVLEGVIDPENPVLGSARRGSTVSRATSAQSIIKSPRKTKSPLRTTLLESVGAHEKKVGVKKKKEKEPEKEEPKKKKINARTESLPEVEKKHKLFEISQNSLKDPEKNSLNQLIVKHGEFVKKRSPYNKPRSMIFTPERPPLVRKTLVQKVEPAAQSHLDRIILSQFGENQDNSNLRQIYNSKSNSINDFINYRLKRFQPANVSTRTQVRVAKELQGDGTDMRKVPPKFKGVLDKDAPTKQDEKRTPASRQHSPLPEHKTPVDLRKIEKFLHKKIEPPKNVINLSDNAQYLGHLKNTGKSKEAMNATLPILFEERHEPSEHDSIFNISMESKQGKMSLRRYNIEKRKEKMEREAKQKKIQDEKRALFEQHKKRLIDQAFKDEDYGIKSNSKTVFSKRSLLSSKKTSEHGAIESQIVTTPIASPLPPPGVHVEVRKISEIRKEKRKAKTKTKRNPINDLMQLIKQKTESSSPRFIKDLIQKRNKVSRACREMTQAITNFLDNIQVNAEEFDADEDNLHEMMDEVHIANNLDSSMKFGESLKLAKNEANETTIFVNKMGTALKNQWKPARMKINHDTLRIRSEAEATRSLELRASQVTSAKKSPNVMVPALLDEKMKVMEQGFKIS